MSEPAPKAPPKKNSFAERKATRLCKKPARGATADEMRAYRKQRKQYWLRNASKVRTGLRRKHVGQSKYMPHQGGGQA